MKPWHKLLLLSFFGILFAQSFVTVIMRYSRGVPHLFTAISFLPFHGSAEDRNDYYKTCPANVDVSLSWHPAPKTRVNDIENVIIGEGTQELLYDSSDGPRNIYNYCNMPRANEATYPEADREYTLLYVEIISRHHKRTPYAANTFPFEPVPWKCADDSLYYGAMSHDEGSRATYWQVYNSPSNPFQQSGFNGTCMFPQITADGLEDAHKHGQDLLNVYQSELGRNILPDYNSHTQTFRVTNNVITSQTAAMFMQGMWPERVDMNTPLLVQPPSIDSLEPSYPCPYADRLLATYGPGSDSPDWRQHLDRSSELKQRLDRLTGINPNDQEWSKSWDHYFDNLSSRRCHQKPLPCLREATEDCITKEDADMVFRLGQYEYSYIYRDSAELFNASVAAYGVYIGELAQNLRSQWDGNEKSSVPATSERVRVRLNFAHDGSIARLLSVLQINQMVWPGMGAEVIFELYSRNECAFVRVLWGGQVLRSNHPDLGRIDMIPLATLLAYFDGLVGKQGSKIPGMCKS